MSDEEKLKADIADLAASLGLQGSKVDNLVKIHLKMYALCNVAVGYPDTVAQIYQNIANDFHEIIKASYALEKQQTRKGSLYTFPDQSSKDGYRANEITKFKGSFKDFFRMMKPRIEYEARLRTTKGLDKLDEDDKRIDADSRGENFGIQHDKAIISRCKKFDWINATELVKQVSGRFVKSLLCKFQQFRRRANRANNDIPGGNQENSS